MGTHDEDGTLEPHIYIPDWMTMGNCMVCGHVQDAPIHQEIVTHTVDRTEMVMTRVWADGVPCGRFIGSDAIDDALGIAKTQLELGKMKVTIRCLSHASIGKKK